MMTKILLDTDIGGDIDDAVCLAYLLKEPQCELLGITSVCGQSEVRARIASAICKAANRKILIVAGADLPLKPIVLYPTPTGAPALAKWPHDAYEKGDAPRFLYEQIKQHPHEVTLVGIGTMTNIANLFTRYPDAKDLLAGLHVMNGYFGKEPLADPMYNFNSWADAKASKIVFEKRVKRHRAMSIEITETLSLPAAEAEALFDEKTPLHQAVLAFGQPWLQDANTLTLHDVLAAMTVFYPELCEYQRGIVQVDEEDGATVFEADRSGNVEITRSVDKKRFWQILKETLNHKEIAE